MIYFINSDDLLIYFINSRWSILSIRPQSARILMHSAEDFCPEELSLISDPWSWSYPIDPTQTMHLDHGPAKLKKNFDANSLPPPSAEAFWIFKRTFVWIQTNYVWIINFSIVIDHQAGQIFECEMKLLINVNENIDASGRPKIWIEIVDE